MIRLAGMSAIVVAVALISFRIGMECAIYWASPWELAEAAKLRINYLTGMGQ